MGVRFAHRSGPQILIKTVLMMAALVYLVRLSRTV